MQRLSVLLFLRLLLHYSSFLSRRRRECRILKLLRVRLGESELWRREKRGEKDMRSLNPPSLKHERSSSFLLFFLPPSLNESACVLRAHDNTTTLYSAHLERPPSF